MTVALVAAACSSSSPAKSAGTTTRGSSPSTSAADATTTTPRPSGPAAKLSELTGGNGPFVANAYGNFLKGTGYVEHEYEAAGTATSYKPTATLTADGQWQLAPDKSAPYRTRIVVRR